MTGADPRPTGRGPRLRGLTSGGLRSRGRPVRGPRSWTRAGALATAPAVLAVLALVHPGQPVAQLDLHDAGVWLTNSAELRLGRYSATVDELNGGLVTTSDDIDVLQDGADVVLLEPGTLSAVDPASVTPTAEATVPAAARVSMAGGTVAVVDPADGAVWAGATASLGDLRTDAAPALRLGPGGGAVVTRGGSVLAAAADGAVTVLTVDDAGVRAADADPLPDAPAGGWDEVTAVGEHTVALAGSTVHTASGATDLSRHGGPLVLQQPGPDADAVLVAGPTALLEVPLDGGPVVAHPSEGSGTPAAPVRVGPCAHAAWATAAGSYLLACDGRPDERVDLEGMSAQDALTFRVNRSVVVLNDTLRGRVWVPAEDPRLREPNWQDVEPERPEHDSADASDARLSTQDLVTGCTPQSAPPTASDDTLGLRPGRSTVLPVLDNDAAADCGLLVVSEFDPLPPAFGVLTAVHGGRALQVDVADGATGTASFTYTVTDGRGSSAPSTATVRLTVRPAATNASPVQVRVPAVVVEQGARVSLDVLPGFQDPDGDDLVLSGATADAGATAQSRPDGEVTVVADGGALGRVDVHLLVSDGTATTEGRLTVDVRPAGSVVPQVDPVHAVTEVDTPVTVAVLDRVRTGTREVARLAAVEPPTGATVTPDTAAGAFTFTAARAGTYHVAFTVTAGVQQTTGVARVDVRERAAQPGAPVAVADRALLPEGGEVTVDPLANDLDPAGGVLVLESVDVPADRGLDVATLGHQLLRLTSTRVLTEPVTLGYVVSNGVGRSRGQVLVRSVPAAAAQVAPLVPDVTATVRTGGLVTVPVLDHAVDPDGDPLTLVPELTGTLPDGQGLLFASGDVLRYRAPAQPTTARTTFAVRDADGNVTSGWLTVTVHASDPATKAPPAPEPLTARAFAGETTRITVPLVGIDADGDGATLLGVDRAPTKGRIVGRGADWLEYEAFGDARGTDEFTYAVEDWVGQRAVATVRVGLAARPVVAAPVVARDDAVRVRPGQVVEVRVLANDVDGSGADLDLAPELELQPGVDARAVGRRVVVHAPDRAGVLQIAYTATNGRAGRDTAVLTVTVDPEAPVLPPVARDVVVPATETLGRTQVEVDVLALAENPSGPLSDLTVSVDPSAADVARVTADGTVLVRLVEHAQTLPYVLTTRARTSGPAPRSVAFVTVPALGDFPPVLRPRAPALRVLAGEPLVVPLAEQVQVAPGRTARITDPTRVQATRADGSELVADPTTLVFRAPRSYAGPASLSVEVTDAVAPGDPDARTRTLSLPITVLAAEDHPPTFVPSVVDVAPGEAPLRVDLDAFTSDPVGAAGTPGADAYRYTLTSAVPPGFTATVSGSVLQVAASATATRGTTASLGLGIGYGTGDGEVGARVELRVVASTRPLARVVGVSVPDGVGGRTTSVDVLAGAFNPFRDAPLTVLDATVETPGAGTAQVAGDRVDVRPDEGFVGTMVTRFSVRDVTGDPARQVEGRIAVTVRGRPGTPTAPRVVSTGDRAVALAWDAPATNGEPITGYRVTAQPGGVVRECPGTTCTVEGLTNDTTYTFTVAAGNAVDWSDPSAPSAPARPDRSPDAPATPTVVAGDGELTATWPAAPSAGSPVQRYTVEVSPAPAAGGTLTTAGTSVRVTGATNGVAYAVRVRAHNAADEAGAWSPWSAGQVPAAPPAAPAPTATRLDRGWFEGAGRIDVAWTAPAGNGDAVGGYEVAVDGVTVQSLPGGVTTWTFGDAQRGRSYGFAVRARNKAGWSSWAPVTGSTWSAPSPPRSATATSASGPGTAWGHGALTLTWEPPADPGGEGITVTGYDLEGPDGSAVRLTGTSHTVTGLVGGPTPTYRVRAVSSAGEAGEWVTIGPTTVTTVPQAPVVTVDADADRRLVVGWGQRHDGGGAVTRARYRVDGGEWVEVGPDGAPVTTDRRLAAGEAVRVEVQVGNGSGWSVAGEATGAPVGQGGG